MRATVAAAAIVTAAAVAGVGAAQRQARPPLRTSQDVSCAAALGAGVDTKRTFCDVVIAKTPAESVLLRIPPHNGAATLTFDLHNRFAVPIVAQPPHVAYAKHDVGVAVIRATGEVIARAAVVKEFVSVKDLFDRIAGGGRPGGVKAVAPGAPMTWTITIPAGVPAVGIVGERLRVITAAADAITDAPGRPIAIVSNVRVDYAPVR